MEGSDTSLSPDQDIGSSGVCNLEHLVTGNLPDAAIALAVSLVSVTR